MSKENELYDCLIIGGGPAGLSASIYASRACLKTAIIEKADPGGKLNKTLSIENYPGHRDNEGRKLAENMFNQATEMGIDFLWGDVRKISKEKENIWKVSTEEKSYISRTILIASGMKERVLDIPNVKEYYGRGISYCAICDGNLYKGKKVIVVGGGNSAVEEAMYLSKIVSEVELIHRREEFRADQISVKKMQKIGNIKINIPFIPIEVKIENNKVTGLVIENTKTKEKKYIKGECVFFYVGLIPENYFLNNLDIETDEMGFIKVDQDMRSSVPGIFAAGDIIHKHLRQVVTAVSDGAISAMSIKNYLESLK